MKLRVVLALSLCSWVVAACDSSNGGANAGNGAQGGGVEGDASQGGGDGSSGSDGGSASDGSEENAPQFTSKVVVGDLSASEQVPTDPVECVVADRSFKTPQLSCDAAISWGEWLVADTRQTDPGLPEGSDAVQAEIGAICSAIQGAESMPASQSQINLAQRLSDEGVCPGNVELLQLDSGAG